MKLAHSSDWHLGKTLFARPLIDDQRTALTELKERLKTENVEVLLLAGDLFDRSVPPEDAVRLLDGFLTSVVTELKIPVCMIPGNHDSSTRVGAGANLLRSAGLHVFATPESIHTPALFTNDSGKTAVFGVPYLEPGEWGAYFRTETSLRSHEDALRLILGALESQIVELRHQGWKIVLLLHAYVMGGSVSESERPLSIGGSEMVPSELLKPFDYVALGHLHRPQKVSYENVRYSGSLFPYSQSESDQERGFMLVDFSKSESQGRFRFEPFQTTRKLRTIEGSFEDLVASEALRGQKQKSDPHDYVIALITDDSLPFEAFRRLNTVVPNLLHIGRKSDWKADAAEASDLLHRKLQQELSDQDILRTFIEAAALDTSTEETRKQDLIWLQEMFEMFRASNKDSETGV